MLVRIGGAANVDNNGQDVNKPFTAQTSELFTVPFGQCNLNIVDTFSILATNPIETTFRSRFSWMADPEAISILA